jgi:Ca2+-binding RTX toxin-like protein
MTITVTGTDIGSPNSAFANFVDANILAAVTGSAIVYGNIYESSITEPNYSFLINQVVVDDEDVLATNDSLNFKNASQFGIITSYINGYGNQEDLYSINGMIITGSATTINGLYYVNGDFRDGENFASRTGLIEISGPAGDDYFVPPQKNGANYAAPKWTGFSWNFTQFMDAAAALRAGNAAPLNVLFNSEVYVFDGGSRNEYFYGYALNDTLYGNAGSDTLAGGGGNDVLYGGDDGDSLLGDVGNDTLWGSFGNDTMRGGDNADLLWGQDDSDTLWGDAGNDTLSGGNGVDALIGGLDNDTLYGDANDDELQGDSGNDGLYGGDGADRLYGDMALIAGPTGNDTLDGGTGLDQLWGGTGDDLYVLGDINPFGGGQSYDLVTELANAGSDTIYIAPGAIAEYVLPANVENLVIFGSTAMDVIGNELDNQLYGNTAENGLSGGNGDDVLGGAESYDILVGGAGDDTYILTDTNSRPEFINRVYDLIFEQYGGGTDTIQVARAPSSARFSFITMDFVYTYYSGYTLPEAFENGQVIGTDAFDLTGNGANNVLMGNTAANLLSGVAGNDFLTGGAGDDNLNGGADFDYANYLDASTTAGITLSLAITTAQNTGGAGTDTLTSIEGIYGSNFGDTLTGDGTAVNALFGWGGADSLVGNGGFDYIEAGEGNDTLDGGAGDDFLLGGNGIDWVSYYGSAAAVYVDMSGASAFANSTSTGFDVLSGIERVYGSIYGDFLFGSAGSDTLIGDNGVDIIYGFGLGDSLDGGGDTDYIVGGVGADTITTGTGQDYIYFQGQNEGKDTVTDWRASGFDLLVIDEPAFGAGLITGQYLSSESWRFVAGTAATGAFGQFLWNSATSTLSWDADGTGVGAAVQLVTLTGITSLTAGDILVL